MALNEAAASRVIPVPPKLRVAPVPLSTWLVIPALPMAMALPVMLKSAVALLSVIARLKPVRLRRLLLIVKLSATLWKLASAVLKWRASLLAGISPETTAVPEVLVQLSALKFPSVVPSQ